MQTQCLIYFCTAVYVQAQVQNCQPTHTGPMCEKCIDGWYGQNCTQACRQNCIACTHVFGTCAECRDGYRDYDCSQYCSEGCVDKLCNLIDAVCERGCKPGHSGAYCCQPGMFGWLCEINCPTNCATCTSMTNCQRCKYGFYGSTCNKICPVNCKMCISTGYCPACKNGYTGQTCQIRCPEHCLTCNNNDKTCVTCKEGFSRPDIECQCLNTMCTSSECMSCANSTYYADGYTCCQCNSNCKNGSCTLADQCTYGCEDGLFGPKCELPCTKLNMKCSICSGSSLETSVCTKCIYGYYPHTNRSCVQCSSLCVECQFKSNNGYCEKGCKNGFWNQSCDRKCNEQCKICNQDSGDCLICSSTSVFGANCDKQCSNTCINASCHMNGTCTRGCIYDYYGPSCKQCPTNCARGANGTRCPHATGLCLFGCNEGFKGESCIEDIKLDNSKDTVPGAALGCGVAAAVTVALAVVVGIPICIRRRNRTLLYDNVVRHANTDCTEHTYDGIRMNVSAETANVCSTTGVSTHTDYQNTRLTETPEQTANEEHTYEIAI